MPRLHRFALALLVFGTACGEGGGDGPPDPPVDAVEVSLGTGPERTGNPGYEPRFEPVAPGEPILMATGGQGAVYHAPVALRVTDPEAVFPDPVWVRGEGRRASDGLLVARVSTFVRMIPDEAGLISDTPVRVLLCPTPVGESLIDGLIELELRLEDDEGGLLYGQGAMSFGIQCPDDLCNQICAGL